VAVKKSYQLPATSRQLPAISCQPSAASHQLPVISCQLESRNGFLIKPEAGSWKLVAGSFQLYYVD
jgi:hypothetical protein